MAETNNRFDVLETEDKEHISLPTDRKRKDISSASSDDSLVSSPVYKKSFQATEQPTNSSVFVSPIPCKPDSMDEDQLTLASLYNHIKTLATSEQVRVLTDELRDLKREIGDIRKEMNDVKQSVNTRVDKVEGQIHEMEVKVEEILKENKDLKRINTNLTSRIELCESMCNDNEQYSRRWNIKVFNLPGDLKEDNDVTTTKVCDYFTNTVQEETKPEDIEVCHRVPKAPNSKCKYPAIVVRFMNRGLRDRLLQNKRKCKDSGSSIGEDLTKANAMLSLAAYRHSACSNSWTVNGKVKALLKNGKKISVPFGCDVDSLFRKEMS